MEKGGSKRRRSSSNDTNAVDDQPPSKISKPEFATRKTKVILSRKGFDSGTGTDF
jgi:hypothetical protein